MSDETQHGPNWAGTCLGFVLLVISFAMTAWLNDAPSNQPIFRTVMAFSGPSALFLGTHGSWLFWAIGFGFVCLPFYKRLTWGTAAISAAIWLFEGMILGGGIFFLFVT